MNELPLPPGVLHAKYVDGMREVMQYDILQDEYKLRYDWMRSGTQCTYIPKPIGIGSELEVEEALIGRRAEALKIKGP